MYSVLIITGAGTKLNPSYYATDNQDGNGRQLKPLLFRKFGLSQQFDSPPFVKQPQHH
jgi:hypothetical protein